MNNTERIAEISTKELLKAAQCAYLACEQQVADDIAVKLNWAASEIERLTQGIKDTGKECARRYDEIQRLTAELEQKTRELERHREAEKAGRLVVLPCKAGGSIWWNGDLHSEPKELRVTSAAVGINGVYECSTWGGNFTPVYVRVEDLGKTWFLTRAEAAAALSAEGGVGVNSKTPYCSDCEYHACGFGRIPYRICKKAAKPIEKIGGYKTSPMWCPRRKERRE